MRFLVAVAGVAFASTLMLMQLGFMDALFRSAVEVPVRLAADLVMISSRYTALARPTDFPTRRLQQARAFAGVESVAPVHTVSPTGRTRRPPNSIPSSSSGSIRRAKASSSQELAAKVQTVRYPDVAIFDEASRPEFGPVAQLVRQNGSRRPK